MYFAGLIYTDDFCFKNMKKIRNIIESGKRYVDPSFYCIVLNEYNSQIEFLNYIYLQQKHFKDNPPLLIGLAKDYDEASKLVSYMVKNCFDKIGCLDYISYLASFPEVTNLSCDEPQIIKISGGKAHA